MADRYLLESGAPDGYQLEDASGVVLLETGDTVAPAARRVSADGNLGILTLGAAIGLISIWGVTANRPVPQPTPQPAQWEQASRDLTQPQPQFSKGIFTAAAVVAQPNRQFFVPPQADPTQAQPQYWKPQLDLVAISSGQGTLSPQQVEQDRQPQFWRAAFIQSQTPGTKQPGPTWTARPQDDLNQIQPWFAKQAPINLAPQLVTLWTAQPQADPTQIPLWFSGQTIGQRVTPPTGPLWTAKPQDDPSQMQPQVWRQQLTSALASPVPFQWVARPQDDPSQIQPWFSTQQPPSQATQQPPTPQWFAFPQADPTQIQPAFFRIAFIPSFTPPTPIGANTIRGGVWSPFGLANTVIGNGGGL